MMMIIPVYSIQLNSFLLTQPKAQRVSRLGVFLLMSVSTLSFPYNSQSNYQHHRSLLLDFFLSFNIFFFFYFFFNNCSSQSQIASKTQNYYCCCVIAGEIKCEVRGEDEDDDYDALGVLYWLW